MKKLTQSEIVIKVLSDGAWHYSYEFVKASTPWGWLGTSGDRRARELVASGTLEKRSMGKYEQFRLKDRPPRVESKFAREVIGVPTLF